MQIISRNRLQGRTKIVLLSFPRRFEFKHGSSLMKFTRLLFISRALRWPLAVIYTLAPWYRHACISVYVYGGNSIAAPADELFRKNFCAARVTSVRHFPHNFLIALLFVFLTVPLSLSHTRSILRIAVFRRVILSCFAKKSRDVSRRSTAASRFRVFINS